MGAPWAGRAGSASRSPASSDGTMPTARSNASRPATSRGRPGRTSPTFRSGSSTPVGEVAVAPAAPGPVDVDALQLQVVRDPVAAPLPAEPALPEPGVVPL